jgi:hypothetical protein
MRAGCDEDQKYQSEQYFHEAATFWSMMNVPDTSTVTDFSLEEWG